MIVSRTLTWAYDRLLSSGEVSGSENMKLIESLARKYHKYEELASIFQKAQESLEDAKDRLVEP